MSKENDQLVTVPEFDGPVGPTEKKLYDYLIGETLGESVRSRAFEDHSSNRWLNEFRDIRIGQLEQAIEGGKSTVKAESNLRLAELELAQASERQRISRTTIPGYAQAYTEVDMLVQGMYGEMYKSGEHDGYSALDKAFSDRLSEFGTFVNAKIDFTSVG